MSRNTLLTGSPGCGKTTAIRRTLDRLPSLRIGGLYTEELREGRRRVGFRIVGLGIGEGILAHVNCRSRFRVSKYGVNVDDIERVGVAALERALDESDHILIDEIGRMEMFAPSFCATVMACLDSPRSVLGTLQARRNPFLDGVRARTDLTLVVVTPENRDALPAQLAGELEHLAASQPAGGAG